MGHWSAVSTFHSVTAARSLAVSFCVGFGTPLLPFDGDADGRIVQPAHPSADLPQRQPTVPPRQPHPEM
jgi:hypothetical protein